MKFRKFLLGDGYDMIQWSVYGRVVNGFDDFEKHLKRLSANLPSAGAVRYWQMTEKQFVSSKVLVGKLSKQEKTVNSSQLLLF